MTTNGKPPAPPRVKDISQYWTNQPPEISARCMWWVHRIEHEGWRPNMRVRTQGYDGCAHYFGVYIWEWLNVLSPLLDKVIPERKVHYGYDNTAA